MVTEFVYHLPVKIHFGKGKFDALPQILEELGVKSCVIACDSFFGSKRDEFMAMSPCIKAVYTDVLPDPQISGVRDVVGLMREHDADAVLGFGGGASMDTAKFAAAVCYGEHDVLEYFYKRQAFPEKVAKIIAVPTTSGTGSEVTQVSVTNDGEYKQTINDPAFRVNTCIIDSNLMATVPPKVTMQTGLDALSHAIEGYWSRFHQPITDLVAIEAIKEILAYQERAFLDGSDEEARDHMAYAALLAGIAFGQPKTAACHACSYPLAMTFHMPHGEACAFTLDKLIDMYYDERLQRLIEAVGLKTKEELSAKILYLKKLGGLKTKLTDLGDNVDVDKLAAECAVHPQMANSTIAFTPEQFKEMFLSMTE